MTERACGSRVSTLSLFILFYGNDMNGSVLHLGEKPVNNGAAPKNVPSAAGGLAEDDMRDPNFPCVSKQGVRDVGGFQLNDLCTKSFSEPDILLQGSVCFRIDASGLLLRRFDVNRKPVLGCKAAPRCANRSGGSFSHSRGKPCIPLLSQG